MSLEQLYNRNPMQQLSQMSAGMQAAWGLPMALQQMEEDKMGARYNEQALAQNDLLRKYQELQNTGQDISNQSNQFELPVHQQRGMQSQLEMNTPGFMQGAVDATMQENRAKQFEATTRGNVAEEMQNISPKIAASEGNKKLRYEQSQNIIRVLKDFGLAKKQGKTDTVTLQSIAGQLSPEDDKLMTHYLNMFNGDADQAAKFVQQFWEADATNNPDAILKLMMLQYENMFREKIARVNASSSGSNKDTDYQLILKRVMSDPAWKDKSPVEQTAKASELYSGRSATGQPSIERTEKQVPIMKDGKIVGYRTIFGSEKTRTPGQSTETNVLNGWKEVPSQ